MPLFLISAMAASALIEPMDLPAVDRAIESCDRAAVLPVFAAEAQRRSAFATSVYQEQAAISIERKVAADARRALREAALNVPANTGTSSTQGTDRELELKQLALEDRQRALDDRRRLEQIRQQAVDLKRNYFLSRCPADKKTK